MKIIHLYRSIDPEFGGPAQVMVRLAAAQAALGHDVHILAYTHPAEEPRIGRQIAGVPHIQQVHIHLIPPGSGFEPLLPRTARRMLNNLLEDADFLHLHGVWERFLKVAADMAAMRAIPYCFRPAGMLD